MMKKIAKKTMVNLRKLIHKIVMRIPYFQKKSLDALKTALKTEIDKGDVKTLSLNDVLAFGSDNDDDEEFTVTTKTITDDEVPTDILEKAE